MLRKCPKCGKVLPENMFAPNTDHCRICRRDYDWQYRYGLSPGEVRGLLCDQCNRGLGYFHENIEVMKKAIEYLEESKWALD